VKAWRTAPGDVLWVVSLSLLTGKNQWPTDFRCVGVPYQPVKPPPAVVAPALIAAAQIQLMFPGRTTAPSHARLVQLATVTTEKLAMSTAATDSIYKSMPHPVPSATTRRHGARRQGRKEPESSGPGRVRIAGQLSTPVTTSFNPALGRLLSATLLTQNVLATMDFAKFFLQHFVFEIQKAISKQHGAAPALLQSEREFLGFPLPVRFCGCVWVCVCVCV